MLITRLLCLGPPSDRTSIEIDVRPEKLANGSDSVAPSTSHDAEPNERATLDEWAREQQHPNILPLHDSGEAADFLFYVMPYVEGDTLKDRLDREGQLPVSEAVAIARDMAEALQAAHEHGVIHRDIKPGNVLISRGKPLIADFGIALALSSAGAGELLTKGGLSLGTPHYMSPERVTGERTVGPASDTWALGCVLYEMLAGEPPYTGASAQAVLGKIIAGEPISAREQRPSVPANVDAAVRKALATFMRIRRHHSSARGLGFSSRSGATTSSPTARSPLCSRAIVPCSAAAELPSYRWSSTSLRS